jgi:hypothetical protein
VLLFDRWAELDDTVPGDLVVAPLGRDLVLFTGSEAAGALQRLRLVLEKEAVEPSAPYPITTSLYRLGKSGWLAFE